MRETHIWCFWTHRAIWKVSILGSVIFLIVTLCFVMLLRKEGKLATEEGMTRTVISSVNSNPARQTNGTPKLILWYYSPRYLKGQVNHGPLRRCPERNCRMTEDRTLLHKSDAVIFSAEHIVDRKPPFKKTGQVWVFHNNEPPFLFTKNRAFQTKYWSSMFNWTMDFRSDADIVRPYGVLRRRSPPQKNYNWIVKQKKSIAAIMLSNCNDWSSRRKYVRELQQHIPVDVYGDCGDHHSFPRSKNNEWLSHLNKTYKFYLAFENTHCKDYISEKAFLYYDLDLVLVTRGGGNYSRDVPDKTYLNVYDFKTPKDLAKELMRLNNSPSDYIDILKRKNEYYYDFERYQFIDVKKQIFLEFYYEEAALCQLCERLMQLEKYTKTISDINEWFKEGICREA